MLYLSLLLSIFFVQSVRANAGLAEARALAAQGRYDEAEQVYRALVEQDAPIEVAAELAGLYEQLGEIGAAVEMYERVVAIGGLPEAQARRMESRLQLCRRQRESLVRFPVSVEAHTDVRQVETLLGARQWTAAFVALAGVLDRFQGTFLQREPNVYQGLWQWARITLDELPDAGRHAYGTPHASEGPDGGTIRNRWLEALADGSTGDLERFILNHPSRQATGPAFLAWAEALADRGSLLRALGLLDRAAGDDLAVAQRRRWWLERLEAGQAGLPAEMPSPGEVKPAVVEQFLRQPDNVLTIRNAAGSCTADGLNRTVVAAGEGLVFVYQGFQLDAYETGGAWRWRYQPREPLARRDRDRELYAITRWPRHKWTGGIDPPAVLLCPAGLVISEVYDQGTAEGGGAARVESVLTCLDPQTGAVRWRLAEDALFGAWKAASHPVYSGGKVLFIAATRGEYPEFWLTALDAVSGQLLWRQKTASGAMPTRFLGRGLVHAGQSGPTLAVDPVTATVYYATHMGAVVAIDRDLAQPLWALAYSRVPRCGPLAQGPLPLLERRTEAMQVTKRHLLLLPRDLNGLLIIDRATGRLHRTIRSLDLLGLIAATDEQAVLVTLSGEVRSYRIEDGALSWAWRPAAVEDLSHKSLPVEEKTAATEAGRYSSRPVRVGDEIWAVQGAEPLTRDGRRGDPERLRGVACQGEVIRLRMADGAVAGRRPLEQNPHLSAALPAGYVAATFPEGIKVYTGMHGNHVTAAPPELVTAQAASSERQAAWSYQAFVPGTKEARLVAPGGQPMLIVADEGLSGLALADRVERRWWRGFDADAGVWAAAGSTCSGNPAAEDTADFVALTEDRHNIVVVDVLTGNVRAAGVAGAVLPVRELYVAGQQVVAAGASRLACLRVPRSSEAPGADAGALEVAWEMNTSPRVLRVIDVTPELTTLLVQSHEADPARVVRLETSTGRQVSDHLLAVPPPRPMAPGDQDSPDRFTLHELKYRQSELAASAGGYAIRREAQTIELHAQPARFLACAGNRVMLEIADFWTAVDVADGTVELVSLHAASRPKSNLAHSVAEWLRLHPGHERDKRPEFAFSGPGLRWVQEPCAAGMAGSGCGALAGADGERLALAGLRPRRMDVGADRVMVDGLAGTLVLRRAVAGDDQPVAGLDGSGPDARVNRAGRDPADLFDPPAVPVQAMTGLVLDGDVSDWDAARWIKLSPDRHLWPAGQETSADRSSVAGEGAFQWSLDPSALWLAVRVERDLQAATPEEAAPGSGPSQTGLEILLVAENRQAPQHQSDRVATWRVTVSHIDGVPVGRIHTGRGFKLAVPIGFEGHVDSQFNGSYPAGIDPLVGLASRRRGTTSVYEWRFDRRLFAEKEPRAFDIRVRAGDGDGQSRVWLEWAGALRHPAVFPPAGLLSAEAPPER